jgi:hypothetical protein
MAKPRGRKQSKARTFACSRCPAEEAASRLPRGWKTHPTGAFLCDDCLCRHYAPRSVEFVVERVQGAAWAEFAAAADNALRLSTDAANWCVLALARLDSPNVRAEPQAVRAFYPYGEYAKSHPDYLVKWGGQTTSMNICLRYAHGKYRRERFRVMIEHAHSLLAIRFPYPFPFDADAWKGGLSFVTGAFPGEAPAVTLRLPGTPDPVTLVLSRGPDFRRQIAGFRELLSRDAIPAEASLRRDRKGRFLLKLVGRFPKRERTDTPNAVFIHTDPNALLVVEINGHRANVTNADHIRREFARNANMIDRHRAMLQRTREDKKREVRLDRKQRKNLEDYVAERCAKQNDRLKTFTQQVAAQVARMCERRQVGEVIFDDTNKAFFGSAERSFPWSALKTCLQNHLINRMGCGWIDGQFTHLRDEKEKEEWLASQRAARGLALATAGRRVDAAKRRKGSHPAVTPLPGPKRASSKVSPSRSSARSSPFPRSVTRKPIRGTPATPSTA